MTRYEVEPAPGQPRNRTLQWEGTGWRVVAVTDGKRRPFLTRFQKEAHAREEALRLTERDKLLVRR